VRSGSPCWLLLGALLLLPCAARANDAGQTFRRTAADGQPVLLHQYANWDQSCHSNGDPIITVLTQPVGGTLDQRHEMKADAGTARVGSTRCVGTPIPSVGLYYIPKPGFKGTDTFQFEVRYGNGIVTDTAIIEVH
jgi:hypothetical protein